MATRPKEHLCENCLLVFRSKLDLLTHQKICRKKFDPGVSFLQDDNLTKKLPRIPTEEKNLPFSSSQPESNSGFDAALNKATELIRKKQSKRGNVSKEERPNCPTCEEKIAKGKHVLQCNTCGHIHHKTRNIGISKAGLLSGNADYV